MLVLAFHPEKVVMGKESAAKFGGPALFFAPLVYSFYEYLNWNYVFHKCMQSGYFRSCQRDTKRKTKRKRRQKISSHGDAGI